MSCLVIAHRGASFDERENTVPAFERAIAMGADYIELDVQASADGALVVFHDARLERLTPLSGPLGARRAAELAEVGIPTLEEVLEVTRGRIGTMAEVKGTHGGRRHDVAARTARLLGEGDVLLSFAPRALRDARAARPGLRLLQHVGPRAPIRAAAPHAWGVGFSDRRLTARGLGAAARHDLVATVYTVNEPDRIRELASLGVGGVFTDRPDVALAALGRSPARRGAAPRGVP
jgi:glycerophosphoryl diester phosphodiesterase